MPTPESEQLGQAVLEAAGQELDAMDDTVSTLPELAQAYSDCVQLSAILSSLPQIAEIDTALNGNIKPIIKDVLNRKESRTALAPVLASLYTLAIDIEAPFATWIAGNQALEGQRTQTRDLIRSLLGHLQRILGQRPDVAAVMSDLTAMQELRGGPADATAFHDFHVLQVAFKDVWLHAFDENLKTAVAQLYEMIVKVAPDSQVVFPPLDAMQDVQQLQSFLRDVKASLDTGQDATIPVEVIQAYPTASVAWGDLSAGQRFVVYLCALVVVNPQSLQADKDQANRSAQAIFQAPDGPGDRLSKTILEIGRAINEPYAFDVFAPNSYNYGLMSTYRQRWQPGAYQAGNLVSTLPLAPGETRKVTHRSVVKKSRAMKEIERSLSSRSTQTSETGRAEREIMARTTTATNFKMTTNGSFNVGIGSFSTTSEFGANQEQFSSQTKKDFHEATVKAAEEYRLERSIEVDTSESEEVENSSSQEISNPNNEITVTYLFYELQRRFRIKEFLYRVRPVILIAQDVPAPHEIDEAWLIQYQWILGRVLLDDSFRSALSYLSTGFAGDEVSIAVLQASWEKQRDLVNKLEALTTSQLATRNALRESIVNQTLAKEEIDDSLSGMGLLDTLTDSIKSGDFTFSNVVKKGASADDIEANRRAAETRLKYVEEALGDAQEKLKAATAAFEAATKSYTNALQNQFNRRVAIDQLRVHVKRNIIYYMQAIWDYEPPDQRFFRLYKLKVICPAKDDKCQPAITGRFIPWRSGRQVARVTVSKICPPAGGVGGVEHELIEVADLDNPLGYKGNYIVFPLKHGCALTDYMVSSYINNYLELMDADLSDSFDPEEFESRWQEAAGDANARAKLQDELTRFITQARRSTEEIIVPTGQLFIEALPGSHPLLEDFKLLHRAQDVLKVKAEVRHAELENLRLAARLAAGEHGDPDIEKQILVSGSAPLVVDANG